MLNYICAYKCYTGAFQISPVGRDTVRGGGRGAVYPLPTIIYNKRKFEMDVIKQFPAPVKINS